MSYTACKKIAVAIKQARLRSTASLKQMSSLRNGVRQNSLSEHLPETIDFLAHQIAGHSHTGRQQIGLLKHKEGYVLKPLQLDEKGVKELGFYEHMSPWQSSKGRMIKDFVPKYLGTVEIDFPFGSRKFLKLEDLVDGYDNPCIADIKIGRDTWDPEASAEKRAKEEKKYRGTKDAYGFSIPGMKFYNAENGETVSYDRSHGLQLDSGTAVVAISSFLNVRHPSSRRVISAFVDELQTLREWFEEQREYLFFATSILLVYSANSIVPLADYSQKNNNNMEVLIEEGPNAVNNPLFHVKGAVHSLRPLVTLKLIDFAHVFPANESSRRQAQFPVASVSRCKNSLLQLMRRQIKESSCRI